LDESGLKVASMSTVTACADSANTAHNRPVNFPNDCVRRQIIVFPSRILLMHGLLEPPQRLTKR
jgi:hypothetical protein